MLVPVCASHHAGARGAGKSARRIGDEVAQTRHMVRTCLSPRTFFISHNRKQDDFSPGTEVLLLLKRKGIGCDDPMLIPEVQRNIVKEVKPPTDLTGGHRPAARLGRNSAIDDCHLGGQ